MKVKMERVELLRHRAKTQPDDTVPKGKLVLSLAFGPGLTVCGMLMEKV